MATYLAHPKIGEKSAARGTALSESVRVQRVSELPDKQSAAIAFHRDGTVIIYMREEDLTPAGAIALEAILAQGRVDYHKQWGLPLALAV